MDLRGADHRLRLSTMPVETASGFLFGGISCRWCEIAVSRRVPAAKPAAGDNCPHPGALDTATGAVVLAGEYRSRERCYHAQRVVLRGERSSHPATGKPHRFRNRGAGTWREKAASAPVLGDYVPPGATFGFAAPRHSIRRSRAGAPPGDRDGSTSWEWTRWSVTASRKHGSREQRDPPSWSSRLKVIARDPGRSPERRIGFPIHGCVPIRYSFPGRLTEAGVEGLRIHGGAVRGRPHLDRSHGPSHGRRGGRMGPRSRHSGDTRTES